MSTSINCRSRDFFPHLLEIDNVDQTRLIFAVFPPQVRRQALKSLSQIPPMDLQGSEQWSLLKKGILDALSDPDELLYVSNFQWNFPFLYLISPDRNRTYTIQPINK